MRDELGRFPREQEFTPGLLAPAFHRLGRRRAIEHAVELGGIELARVILQLVLERQAGREEWPAPGLIVPAGRADQDTGHGVALIPPEHRWSRDGSMTPQAPPCARPRSHPRSMQPLPPSQ